MPMTIVPYYIVTVGSHPFCLLDFVTSETKISSSIFKLHKCGFFSPFWVSGIVVGTGSILVTMIQFLFFEKCAGTDRNMHGDKLSQHSVQCIVTELCLRDIKHKEKKGFFTQA